MGRSRMVSSGFRRNPMCLRRMSLRPTYPDARRKGTVSAPWDSRDRIGGWERTATMEKKQALSKEEARELLRRLEQFYGEPVLPLHKFCQAVELWMECIRKNNTDSGLTQGRGYALQGREYFKSLNQIRIDIRKSNLLGRLLYAKEQFRTRLCPLHGGHWSGEAMF